MAKFFSPFLILAALLMAAAPALAQEPASMESQPKLPMEPPKMYRIIDIGVEGVSSERMRSFVLQASGLLPGQMVQVPGDERFSDAIHALYRLGLFSDVKIIEANRGGQGIYLIVRVTEQPRLAGVSFEGVREKDQKDLENEVMLFEGTHLRSTDVERGRLAVVHYYEEKGYPLADVSVAQEADSAGVRVAYVIDRGPRAEVGRVEVFGNEAVAADRIRKEMKETGKKSWWRFWRKNILSKDKLNEDLARIVAYYNERGHYDARIVRDTNYVEVEDEGTPKTVVEVEVFEGPRYRIGEVSWEGNTVFSDEALTFALGLDPGDWYNGKTFDENLLGNRRGTDVASLYLNRGYLRFNVVPSVQRGGEDRLDLHFQVMEGDVYKFGRIDIAGNLVTREHVARRELYTIPGEIFNRDAITESIRRLIQAGHFTQESLAAGPDISIDEEQKTGDLTYHLEEARRNPLSLGASYSGGLILQLGFNFNNFSLRNLFRPKQWKPLPFGDGQQLSLGVQTSGRDFQQYSFSFTEPWFRGKPTPLGFSASYTHIGDAINTVVDTTASGVLDTWGVSVFHDRRLSWPSDKFTFSSSVRFRHFNNRQWSTVLPDGKSQELVITEGLTRSTLDHPLFARTGSFQQLTVEIAPPIGDLVQYHKWRLRTNWNLPLSRNRKFALSLSTDLGYIGSLTGEDVAFERFIVGGSPFDSQGENTFFGKDIIYMRGYPARSIGPRSDDGELFGGRVLNKVSSELSWMAVQTPALTLMPYLFFDAANSWDSFDAYDPGDLFRSTGVGARINLPMFGLVEFAYGYNLDPFPAIDGHNGQRGWTFQFSLGRSFGL